MQTNTKFLFSLMLCGLLADQLSAGIPPREEAAIQARIDAASAAGGGVVNLPAGRHVVGQLDLKSGVELHLEKGAVLEGGVKVPDTYGRVRVVGLEGVKVPDTYGRVRVVGLGGNRL